MTSVSTDYILLARHLASSSDFKHALSMYVCAFSKSPVYLKHLEDEFRAVLSKITEELDSSESKAAVLARYTSFPGNLDLHVDAGRCLYTYGYMSEALNHFEKALDIDSGYVSVEKDMNNAKIFLFSRNQFKMLNDGIRNRAYRTAIRSVVTTADSVLVVEKGPGVLALYANECNPVAITACKSSSEMAQLAEYVMQDNFAQEVVILHGSSLTLKSTDIYFRRSILLTDLIDPALFGENILQTLCHAWDNLLLPNAKIVPGKAEYFVIGVQCDEIYKKYKLCHDVKNILNVSQKNVHPSTFYNESYYTEDVNMYDNVKYMSEPQLLFTIDFNNIQDVHEKLNKEELFNAEIKATADGEMNVLIGWFNLYLTEDIMVTNDPRAENRLSAYQQAIFFDILCEEVRRNEVINTLFSIHGGRLTTVQDENTEITRVSIETIAFLNDFDFTRTVIQSVDAVCAHLRQTMDVKEIDVVDLSPFPLFGILMLRNSANSLICHVKTKQDEAFLHTVLIANGIPKNKVTILVTDKWSLDHFKDKQFHVIFSQILDFDGAVNAKMFWTVEHLKEFHLIHGGVFLPTSVTVMGQLISSKYLETNNQVLENNVGYRMATRVHRYCVSQLMYLEASKLKYEALSNVFEVAQCGDLNTDAIKVPVLRDGDCNAILCWYKVQLVDGWDAIYTNKNNSLVHSMAYITGPDTIKVVKGDVANIFKCIDPTDMSYKLVMHIDSDSR